MSLSSFNRMGILNHQIPDYLEFARVCAPNAAGQTIASNTITTLELDTEMKDSGNFGSIAANQVTLQPGTYEWELSVPIRDTTNSNIATLIGLYNVTSGKYESRRGSGRYTSGGNPATAWGILTITAAAVFEARILAGVGTLVIDNGSAVAVFTDATANLDQRTTLRLKRYKETITQSQVKIGGGNSWSSYAELRNMVALNVAGQAISADTMTTVQLTEKTYDPDGFVTLAANQFVLGTGTYYVEVDATSILTGGTDGSGPLYYRIQNITDGSVAIIPATSSQKQRSTTPVVDVNVPMESFNGVIVLTGSKTFELQVCCDVGGNLGSAVSATLNTASSNCLARVKIFKR